MRRTNKERAEGTRLALLLAARGLFAEKGYAETATPDIVAAADVTRGALYHHFEDKRAIFHAVVAHESAAVADDIRAATQDMPQDPQHALQAGARAYFAAMQVPGRTRLLLLEGPAVLGMEAVAGLDKRNAEATLREGVASLLASSGGDGGMVDAVTQLLSASFDRAALAIAAGGEAAAYERAIAIFIGAVASDDLRR